MKFVRRESPQGGQALLEILVALAIGIVIATAFVSLGAVAVRNSRFSADQTIATKLATEGIEAMITIRDQNSVGAIQGMAGVDQWRDFFTSDVISSCSPEGQLTTGGCSDFYLQESPCMLGAPQRCIQRNTEPYTSITWSLTGENGAFSRKIRITNTPDAAIKAVTVFVWWTDSAGLHTSVLSRKLHRERLE